MRRRLGFVLVCLLALASCGNSNFERVETGKPYIGLYQGRDVVVVFDQTYEGNVKGRAYLDDGTAVAAPMQFSTGTLYGMSQPRAMMKLVLSGMLSRRSTVNFMLSC